MVTVREYYRVYGNIIEPKCLTRHFCNIVVSERLIVNRLLVSKLSDVSKLLVVSKLLLVSKRLVVSGIRNVERKTKGQGRKSRIF